MVPSSATDCGLDRLGDAIVLLPLSGERHDEMLFEIQ